MLLHVAVYRPKIGTRKNGEGKGKSLSNRFSILNATHPWGAGVDRVEGFWKSFLGSTLELSSVSVRDREPRICSERSCFPFGGTYKVWGSRFAAPLSLDGALSLLFPSGIGLKEESREKFVSLASSTSEKREGGKGKEESEESTAHTQREEREKATGGRANSSSSFCRPVDCGPGMARLLEVKGEAG